MDQMRASVQSSRIIHKSTQNPHVTFYSSSQQMNPKKQPSSTEKESSEDIESVKKLEYWNYSKARGCLTRMNTARESLERKLKSEDIVETQLQKRKLGSNASEAMLTDKGKSKYYKSYEEECLNTYKEIQNKLLVKIERRDGLRKVQIDQKNELDTDQKKLREIEKQRLLAPLKLNISKSGSDQNLVLIEMIKRRTNLLNKNEETRNELIQNIDMLQIEIMEKSKELKVVEEEIDLLRKGQKLVKQDIISFNLKILKQGTDTKGEGLYTTVKLLLGFNIQLTPDNFPTCIDSSSIQCIIDLAQKHLELDQCYEKMAHCYLTKGNLTTRPLSIKARLADLKRTIKVRKPDFSHKKGRIWFKQELLNSSIETLGTNVSENNKIEERIKSLRNEIQDIKDNEVKRLTRECLKSGKDAKVSTAYIVGTDNLVKYKLVILKEFQNLEKIQAKTRTFSFTDYLVPRPKLNLNHN